MADAGAPAASPPLLPLAELEAHFSLAALRAQSEELVGRMKGVRDDPHCVFFGVHNLLDSYGVSARVNWRYSETYRCARTAAQSLDADVRRTDDAVRVLETPPLQERVALGETLAAYRTRYFALRHMMFEFAGAEAEMKNEHCRQCIKDAEKHKYTAHVAKLQRNVAHASREVLVQERVVAARRQEHDDRLADVAAAAGDRDEALVVAWMTADAALDRAEDMLAARVRARDRQQLVRTNVESREEWERPRADRVREHQAAMSCRADSLAQLAASDERLQEVGRREALAFDQIRAQIPRLWGDQRPPRR
jgi:hypothetical protein